MNTNENKLRKLLGSTYGGPSLSYDANAMEFVIYEWFDAPVGEKELWRGEHLRDLPKTLK